MGPIGSPETSVSKYVSYVKIQKNEDIIYTEAKAWKSCLKHSYINGALTYTAR